MAMTSLLGCGVDRFWNGVKTLDPNLAVSDDPQQVAELTGFGTGLKQFYSIDIPYDFCHVAELTGFGTGLKLVNFPHQIYIIFGKLRS